ncbi:MAG: tetratricopeptide repeat protein [Prevotella sp.]
MEEMYSLNEVRSYILESRDLGGAIKLLTETLTTFNYLHADERLEDIRLDYKRMKDFVLRGYNDNQREVLYNQLLRRLLTVVNDVVLQVYLHRNTSYMTASVKSRSIGLTDDEIRAHLEGFVQDTAMLSLSPDEQRRQQIYHDHYDWLSRLFDAILISPQWNESRFQFWANMLVSPTVDLFDASLLTSAVMLSCINIFDMEKFHVLVHVAMSASDENLRQRGLVGAAFALNSELGNMDLYPEIQKWIDALTADDERCRQLLEMQMQVVYCIDVDKDTATIRQDIMPGIMKNQNFTIDHNGIHEKEDNSLDEILHGDDFDQKMEEMEKSMRRMRDMQERGSDIYFGGFSHMKRFAFFYVLSNWFAPFSAEHPALSEVGKRFPGSGLMERIGKNSPFCDSDAYSFALALSTVIDKLPPSVREMLQNSDSVFAMEQTVADRTAPAYIRLMYLQSLYRFFRLYQRKDDFANPFEYGKSDARFFFINPLFLHTPLSRLAVRLEQFMAKRGRIDFLGKLVAHYSDEPLSVPERRMKAVWLEKTGKWNEAAANYKKILEERGDDKMALSKVAWYNVERGNYNDAVECYRKLCGIEPDNLTYQIQLDITLLWTDKADEGMQKLYQLDFTHVDNIDVKRALAWGLLIQGKAKKAEEIYDRLLTGQEVDAVDQLNAGYSKWFQGKVSDAVILFKNYNANSSSNVRAAFNSDSQLLLIYGITGCDKNIMLDLVEE